MAMTQHKRLALIAHDDVKCELLEWATYNRTRLAQHTLDATGTTGRLAVLWNIPIACNRASADFIISSPLMAREYPRRVPDLTAYRERWTAKGDGR